MENKYRWTREFEISDTTAVETSVGRDTVVLVGGPAKRAGRQIFYRELTFDLEIETTDEMSQPTTRGRCYLLIHKMPQVALGEIEENLREALLHYIDLEKIERTRLIPAPKKKVSARVSQYTKT